MVSKIILRRIHSILYEKYWRFFYIMIIPFWQLFKEWKAFESLHTFKYLFFYGRAAQSGAQAGVQIQSQDWGGTQKWFYFFFYLFFFARMQLIPCHKAQLRRGSPYDSKFTYRESFTVLTFLVYPYLTVILVNHNFKGLGHVMSTHVLMFCLPPTLPDPQFFSPSSFSPSVWDYFMHD